MKILLSWSSGKDSAWALHRLNHTHPGAVAGLLTTVNEAVDRVAMHAVRRSVLAAQAQATGLSLRVVPIPHPCPNEVYEERMAAAVAEAVNDGFTHVAFGDLFLEDVRRYREDRLAGTGLEPMFPVWGFPTARLAEEMIEKGVSARLACIDTRVLDAAIIGSAQAVEHYEITRYQSLMAWASEMGRNDFADILGENLAEEVAANERLSALGQKVVNKRAAGKPAVRTSARRSAPKKSAARKAPKRRARKSA